MIGPSCLRVVYICRVAYGVTLSVMKEVAMPLCPEVIRATCLRTVYICCVDCMGADWSRSSRFQGANQNAFSSLRADFKGATTVRLEENYRSTRAIVETSSAIIRRNTGREDKKMMSMGEVGEKIRVVECLCEANEAEFVLEQIQAEKQAGVALNQIAILFRKTQTGRFFQQRLLEAGIPFNKHQACFYRRVQPQSVQQIWTAIQHDGPDHLGVAIRS